MIIGDAIDMARSEVLCSLDEHGADDVDKAAHAAWAAEQVDKLAAECWARRRDAVRRLRESGMTWTAIGAALGVTRARAQQIADMPKVETDDPLTREVRLLCAECNHAQALHCDDPKHPCGCLNRSCDCREFVRPKEDA